MKDQLRQLFHPKSINGREPRGRGFSFFDPCHLNLYHRLPKREINGTVCPTFDVAAVDVDPDHQREGHFTRWLGLLEQVADEEGYIVYVENTHNQQLACFLSRRGYHRCIKWVGPSYYREAGEETDEGNRPPTG